ncbi:hypothetical protein AVEN_97245-1 [Araneus ventricosus]|uniref:Uncharacterized protein n=1 Tax=Araneus ventricosus TaxID=182803 RepID=A0A4Y2JCP6_ARAVE|nr:hypothetical protein AVEN_97245-1 [Araneus ventricosus]
MILTFLIGRLPIVWILMILTFLIGRLPIVWILMILTFLIGRLPIVGILMTLLRENFCAVPPIIVLKSKAHKLGHPTQRCWKLWELEIFHFSITSLEMKKIETRFKSGELLPHRNKQLLGFFAIHT